MPSEPAEQSKPGWTAFVPPGRGSQWPWKKSTCSILGLLLLSLLIAGTTVWGVQHFEQRLDKNVRADLASAGVNLDALELDWEYRNVSVKGELAAEIDEKAIIDVLRAADGGGVRDIELQITRAAPSIATEPELGTIDLTATLSEGKLLLRGTVLTHAQRNVLYDSASAAVGAANVVREIEVSGLQEAIPGADQRVESFANSIAGLDGETEADAALSATDFRFNATVADETQMVDLLQRRGSAGDVGLVISGDIIAKKSVPGSVFDVSASKADDRITLSGVVVSEQQREVLLIAAGEVAGSDTVVDEITVAASDDTGNADDRMQLIIAALGTFDQSIEAQAHITGNLFEFDAMAEFEEETTAMLAVREQASSRGMQVSGVIDSRRISLAKEVVLLQREIELLADEISENVVFESSENVLGFVAKKTLDKVVDAMNRYQRPVVVIAGHTDSSGSSIDNELLSLQRAVVVGQYLEDSGIDQLRLRSVGFGEAIPVASNDTEVGRKRNRRVEFTAESSFDKY